MLESTNAPLSPGSSEQPKQAEAVGATPLAHSLKLSDQDVSLIGRLFNEVTASLGINGEPVFNRLIEGASIGQALAIPDKVVEQIYTRAHSWFSLGRIDRAEPLFRALCLLRDEDADFWVGYGVCLRMTGQYPRAQKAFDSAARLRPDWAVPHFHSLELALHQENWDQAQASLEAYDAKASPELDNRIKHEVERLRIALAMKHAPVHEATKNYKKT